MEQSDIDSLVYLKKDDFEYKEWIALTWVRHHILFEGEFPDPDLDETFKTLYSEKEQLRIIAVYKLMFFFNLLSNTFDRKGSHLLIKFDDVKIERKLDLID